MPQIPLADPCEPRAGAGGSSREEYDADDVGFYFEYMGMLAAEVRLATYSHIAHMICLSMHCAALMPYLSVA